MEKDEVQVAKTNKAKEKEAVKAKSVTLKAKGNSLTGRPLDNIELNPQLGSDRQVTEQSRGGVVLAFGRMNPPTVGHEKLAQKVVATAKSARAVPMIFLSHSQDKKKNPLEYEDKIRFAQAAFGNIVQKAPHRTLIDIAKNLQSKFKELTLVVGSDRVQEFEALLNKYNGKEYQFDKINVVSAGERDPDADDVSGVSASKMRALVQAGDRQKFIQGLPKRLQSHGKQVFDLVQTGMKIHEEMEAEGLLGEALDIQQRRQRAMIIRRYAPKIARAREIAKKRLATNVKLKRRAYIKAREIVRKRVAGKRGQDYRNLSPSEKIQVDLAVDKRKKIVGKIAKRIMPKIKAAEYERLKSFMKGQAMDHLHSGPNIQHEQFNQMFEQYAGSIEITTVDDVIQEMTNLVLDRMMTEKQVGALSKKSIKSGIDYDLLEQVYKRGLVDTMGDEQAAFNRVNAFVCGGRTAMNEDHDLYQQIERPDLNDVFEARQPGKPYVKPMNDSKGNQRGWESSDKWGHKKYWQPFAKKSAMKHAGIDEAFDEVFEGLKDPNDNPCWDGYEPVGTKKKDGKTVPNCVPTKEDLDQTFEQFARQGSKKKQALESPADERREIELVRRGAELPDERDELAMIRRAHQQVKKKVIDESTKLDESFNIALGAGIGVTLTAGDLGMKAQGGFALHPSVIEQEEEFVDETVKAADKKPVVVPAHTDAFGNVIPAKTVLRKTGKPIVNRGDNPSDGD
jgi:nicotinic acid mononucleotide adenylyltransferase